MNNKLNITQAQYAEDSEGNVVKINITVNGVLSGVPLDPANRHYDEIMRQVEAGTLTIQDAE
jgi:hypothetical protein